MYYRFGGPDHWLHVVRKRARCLTFATALTALLPGCGGGGAGDSSRPPPTVSVTISPTTVAAFQDPRPQLTWSSTGADSCTGSGAFNGSQPPTTGSMTLEDPATGNFTYTLTCTGAGGITSASATLTVTPGVEVTVSRTSIPAFDITQPASVSWNSSGVTGCTLSGAWVAIEMEAVPPSGSTPVNHDTAGTNTYTLTCTTPAGAVLSDSATLTVTPGILMYWSARQLGWMTSGTTGDCVASGAWSGSKPSNGTETIAPPTDIGVYTYTLTCPTGSGSISGNQTDSIPPSFSEVGHNGNVYELGESVTLAWSAPGATTCVGSGAWSGPEPTSGTFVFLPTKTGSSTFTISCTGPMGTSSASTDVEVTPFLRLTVSPQTVLAGEPATLSWSSAGPVKCDAAKAWTGTRPTAGQVTTSPVFPGKYSYLLSCADSDHNTQIREAVLTVEPNGFAPTQLASNVSGTALNSDPGLLDPWGIVFPATHAAVVANNRGNTSTSYDGTGAPQSLGNGTTPLAVQLPEGAGGAPFGPTGVVTAPAGTTVTAAGKSGPAQLVYAGENGSIAAWAPTVDPANAITVYSDGGGAIYRSLATAGNFLYAADFHNNKIDVFDSTFAKQAGYTFVDPNLPVGYAPYGLYSDGSSLYVAYAMQLAPANRIAAAGAGLGIIDVFDLKGAFLMRLISGGDLNAPWGMVVTSPAFCLNDAFGSCSFAGTLLVANSGDGRIIGFDRTTGTTVGAVSDANGAPLVIAGLHGIAVGNRYANQPNFTLFYTAGGDSSGLFGRIDFGAAPRLHAPPQVSASFRQETIELRWYFETDITSPVGVAWFDAYDLPGEIYKWRSCCGQFYPDYYRSGTAFSITATDLDGNIATASATRP